MSTILEQTALRIATKAVSDNLKADKRWFDVGKVWTLCQITNSENGYTNTDEGKLLGVIHCTDWDELTGKEIKAVRKAVTTITGIKF